ncbi:MAG: FeoA domain-containing protein [Chthoniobacterales bacterium]|nr:FeoA domain-containing protein [Chthoniobacterales bacterium]
MMRKFGESEILENGLKYLHWLEYEASQEGIGIEELARQLGLDEKAVVELVRRLEEKNFCQVLDKKILLTEDGRRRAREILRAHRLYETYLARRTAYPSEEWHERAEFAEHRLTPKEADAIADELNHPRFDPHGDPIPTRFGDLPPLRGVSLTEAPVGKILEVVHIEDEPIEVWQKCADSGVVPGTRLKILQKSDNFIQIEFEGKRALFEVWIALRIRVVLVECSSEASADVFPLSQLEVGSGGIIVGLSASCRGATRFRLLDLGFVAGSKVRAEFSSFWGSPVAYRIRGTLIALREEQASQVLIRAE